MSNKFNPYYEWLGIPPKHQPADHYRLLGIEQFEADPVVVEHAADQRLGFLRTLQTGARGKIANQLLNEVSQAKTILLDAEKRKTYDATLQSPSQAAPPEPPPRRTTPDTKRRSGGRTQERKSSRRRGRTPTTRRRGRRSVDHEQEEVTEADGVSQRGIKRMRIMAFVLVGLAVILLVFSLRSKPLMVRTYIDQNNNQRFDAGEEEAGVVVVKYFIDPGNPDGGELDTYSWPTDASGIVNFQNIATGLIGFAAENPYQVPGNQDKPYYEAMVDNGLRFFAQVVNIPVLNIERSSMVPVEQHGRTRQRNKGIAAAGKKEPASFIIRGRITDANSKSKDQGLKMRWFIDTDANGVFLNGKERFIEPNDQGRFEVVVKVDEIKDKTTLLVIPRDLDHRYKKSDIPLTLKDIKEGVLEIAVQLERKSISYQGNVQMEPAEELPEGLPEGFVVYLDKNQNSRRDANERYSRTDQRGNFQIEEAWFEDYRRPRILKVEFDVRLYEMPVPTGRGRQNIKLPSITFKDANFKIAKKKIAINPDPIAEVELGPTPEDDPASFLRGLGFSGDLPEEGSDEKPVWKFQMGDELISQFTTAKRVYDKAAKKQNWGKILELEAARKHNDAKIKDILTNAKTEAAKTRAQQKVAPYNEANAKIDAELDPLKESRDALKVYLVMAAQAVEQQQQQYQAALDDTEGVKTAATALGVSIQPLTKKQRAAWQPAIEFLAERELVRLGLQKQGREWVPTGVAIEADGFRQIKMYAQQHFQDYVRKKNNLTALISQNQPSMQSQIDKLEKDLDYQTRAPKYKNAKKEFDRITKTYLEHLDTLQKQRAEIESNQEAIKQILGGAKKMQAVLKQFPTDKAIEKKRTFIMNLQTLVN